jgi:hypothetical protein
MITMELTNIIAYVTEVIVALGGIHILLKKTFGIDVISYFKSKKLADFISIKLKGEIFEQEEDKRENLGLSVEKLKDHDLFIELELQKRILDKVFYTNGEVDATKTKVFEIFIEEKMDSVSWSMTKMLETYNESMTTEQLKLHVLRMFLSCDDNLEDKFHEKLKSYGVSEEKRELVISKFKDARADTLKNYINRIERMFSPSSDYKVSNEFLLLSLFEVIAFEIRGMVQDVITAFENVNGAFVKVKLKKL